MRIWELEMFVFSENLACFVFLKHPFWDSPFCLITDEFEVVRFLGCNLFPNTKKPLVIPAIVSDSADQSCHRIDQNKDGYDRNQWRFLRISQLLTTYLNFKKLLTLILMELQNCLSVITHRWLFFTLLVFTE